MKEINDYGEVFEKIVQKTSEYLINNNIKAMILGISGGIDSTVCAAICHEVSKRINIPLIGRSLPTKHNKENEVTTADLVGKAFCNDYKVCPTQEIYEDFILHIRNCEMHLGIWSGSDHQTTLANGNIQARVRMIYLYNLACIHKGIVIDTDNLTENNLGYFTIHGDVGDFNPIGGLWKTEIFKLAEYISDKYKLITLFDGSDKNKDVNKYKAIDASLQLQPTAGLGITNNDLEELGADSYEQVDYILQEILAWKWLSKQRDDTFGPTWTMRDAFLEEQQMLDMPIEVIIAVTDRHFKSEFKRNKLPIKINREEII